MTKPLLALAFAFASLSIVTTARAETELDGVQRASDVLFWTNVGLEVLHHADHLAREHTDLALFAPTFLLEPTQVALKLYDAGPAIWIPFDGALLVLDLLGHYIQQDIDPVSGAHDHWRTGHNVFDVKSGALGRTSQAVTTLMIATRAARLTTQIIEAKRYGFTWKRQRRAASEQSPSFAVVPHEDGAMVRGAWTF